MRNESLKQILKQTFGHPDFRLNQLDVINSVIDGNDVLAIMPTGGGKSICYQIPALYLDGVTIVVSPLISLMHDQVLNLQGYGVDACFLNSDQDFQERQKAEKKIINGDVKLVYISPEGLLTNHMLNFFSRVKVSLIAIDEAHCVSQWGHEFRKSYTLLGDLKKYFNSVPTMALTATADARTRSDISNQLRLNDPESFISSFDRPNIKYNVYEKDNEIKQLNQFIKNNHSGDTGIVYCLSRKKVEKVADELTSLGHYARPYHAGMELSERRKVQESFNREDKIIIVATIAFGMGIDRPDVRFVAHLDLPKSIESYYQETGRAGRDGKASSAWMVYGLNDVIKLSQMIETSDANDLYKKIAKMKLDAMLSLCETTQCRRKYLLNYFEEELKVNCDNCDTCILPIKTWDAIVDAQKVLSTIFKTSQIFGASYVIDVLRGSKSTKILDKKHDELSVYGIGSEKSKKHWSSVVRQLLHMGYIGIKNWEYNSLCLTSRSGDILKGEVEFRLRTIKEEDIQKANKKRKYSKSGDSSNHGQDELFKELRLLRRELADENNIPPYMIFSDRSLNDMCLILPRDKSEFLMVNGVGESKCSKFAESFLQVIKCYN